MHSTQWDTSLAMHTWNQCYLAIWLAFTHMHWTWLSVFPSSSRGKSSSPFWPPAWATVGLQHTEVGKLLVERLLCKERTECPMLWPTQPHSPTLPTTAVPVFHEGHRVFQIDSLKGRARGGSSSRSWSWLSHPGRHCPSSLCFQAGFEIQETHWAGV